MLWGFSCTWPFLTTMLVLFLGLSGFVPIIIDVNGQSVEQTPPSDQFTNATEPQKPALKTVVGYSIICVTVTNLGALTGIVFSPLKKYRIYGTVLSFMVATAVGSLLSSVALVLVPESLKLADFNPDNSSPHNKTWFVPRSAAIYIGTLAFYILEFLLRRIPSWIEKRGLKSTEDCLVTNGNTAINGHHGHSHFIPKPVPVCDNIAAIPNLPNGLGDNNFTNESTEPADPVCRTEGEHIMVAFNDELKTTSVAEDKLVTCSSRLCSLQPIVWMILIGDGMHNFMDGLSIGAGFTQNARVGLSITLAVLCEELPHELGDIAVLLTAGLNIRMALLFNFLSACTAYVGMIVGILVGELAEAGAFIFALTAGFFLYISLADMLPEMRKVEDSFEAENRNVWCIFVIHLAGLIFGFSCILVVTMTSQLISL